LFEIASPWIALLVGAVVCLLLCLPAPGILRRAGLGQRIREDGPESHLGKAGTPTAGGIVFAVALMLVTLGCFGSFRLLGALVGFFALSCGALGFIDDWLKKTREGSTGLKARYKLAAQVLLGMILGLAAWLLGPASGGAVWIPLYNQWISLGWLHLPLGIVFLTATTNSVNFADGLDGLLGGLGLIIFSMIAVLLTLMAPLMDGLPLAAGLLAGICLGFLFVNWHPAKLFMGDTGSMFLGGGLAALFALSGLHLLLIVMGFVFVLETLSVIIQVTWFQRTGRRVFLMTPIHHHFEKLGMREVRVVLMFWAAGLICGGLGFLIAPSAGP
jgi:phospho-N-acetylmuramoyl-pentapeptide-transferase